MLGDNPSIVELRADDLNANKIFWIYLRQKVRLFKPNELKQSLPCVTLFI